MIQDFIPIYDFSLIEKAIQAFFCQDSIGTFAKPADDTDITREQWQPPAGMIAFYTAFQSLTFTQCRPRVYISQFDIQEMKQWILDANNAARNKAWAGKIRLGIITLPDYTMHTQLRALVNAIIPALQPTPAVAPGPNYGDVIGTTGLNSLLQYHELGRIEVESQNTQVSAIDDSYFSPLTVNLTFSVRANAWPGGTLTT